jgi:hypothetical protein
MFCTCCYYTQLPASDGWREIQTFIPEQLKFRKFSSNLKKKKWNLLGRVYLNFVLPEDGRLLGCCSMWSSFFIFPNVSEEHTAFIFRAGVRRLRKWMIYIRWGERSRQGDCTCAVYFRSRGQVLCHCLECFKVINARILFKVSDVFWWPPLPWKHFPNINLCRAVLVCLYLGVKHMCQEFCIPWIPSVFKSLPSLLSV